MNKNLTFPHALLALLVVAIWGTNFVVAKAALNSQPPFLFALLRFGLVFFPACLFFKCPKVPLWHLVTYGACLGVGQFGLLYLALTAYIQPGLASLLIQTQAFFTIGIAMLLHGERLRWYQMIALGIGFCGIGLIVSHTDHNTTILGVVLILAAAFNWGIANNVNKASAEYLPQINMLAYVVWSAVFACPFLLALSLFFEGPTLIISSLQHLSWQGWLAVFWQSYGNSILGYGIWGWLFTRYSASTVAPLSLLVPVFGMTTAALVMQEAMPLWKISAAMMIVVALALNTLGGRFWPVQPSEMR